MRAFVLLIFFVAMGVSEPLIGGSADGPFEFLFSKCPKPDASGDIGACALDIFNTTLERNRTLFTDGVLVGDQLIVLDPLEVPNIEDGTNRRPKWQLTQMRVTGVSALRLESALLTRRAVAAVVWAPHLTAHVQLTVRISFLPFRRRLTLRLHQPRLMVGADWAPDTERHGAGLRLSAARARLWLPDYNVTVAGGGSTERSLQTALNENSQQIIEFLKPSLEAAVAREVDRFTPQQRHQALDWLRSVVQA